MEGKEIISAEEKNLNSCVIELAEKYLADFPDSQGAWSMYSYALYRVDRFQDAKKSLLKTLELTENSDNNHSWIICKIGSIYEDSGHFHKAIEYFEKAQLSNPNEATFLIYKGVLLLRIGKYKEAAEILIKATKCEKGCIDEAFYNLGVVRIAQSKYQEAAECFKKALEIDPKYKEAKQQLKDVTQVLTILNNI